MLKTCVARSAGSAGDVTSVYVDCSQAARRLGLSVLHATAVTAFNACNSSMQTASLQCFSVSSKGFRSDQRKQVIDHKLRPFCTVCQSFTSIAFISREEKWVQISVEKWNKKKKKRRKNKSSSVTTDNNYISSAANLPTKLFRKYSQHYNTASW